VHGAMEPGLEKKLKNVLDMYEVTKVGGNTDSINTDNISKSGIQ